MGTVLGYLRPHGVRVACGVTVKFTAALLELVLPLLLEHIVDVSVPARDLAAIWICGGLMAALGRPFATSPPTAWRRGCPWRLQRLCGVTCTAGPSASPAPRWTGFPPPPWCPG